MQLYNKLSSSERAKLIDKILDLAGDEFGREELIQLAKKNNNQLRDMWLYFKESINFFNGLI